ncbi:MAG: lipopolysaccharide kinase InaA family protein [Candidatus Paceibacterota bacterium]|jgi:serine/threonine protein kinase
MFKNEIPTAAFEKNEKIKSFYENNKEIIEKLLEETKNKIGEGSTAIVYFLGSNEEICLKILKQEKDITADFHNYVEREVDIMNDLDNLDDSVRTPKPYISAEYYKNEEDKDGTKFILMERIDGYSIRDILEGIGSFPPGFSIDTFRKKVSVFLEKMHKKNIYHRDLSQANIMIHKTTGDPYVIDFGASTQSFGDENPYIQERGSKKPTLLTNDNENLIDVCNMIRKHILTSHK